MTTVTSTSPQRPGHTVHAQAAATPGQVRATVDTARNAGAAWRAMPPDERSRLLGAFADALAVSADRLTDLVVREVGKPTGEARGEVARCVAIARYFAQQTFDPIGSTFESPGAALAYTRKRAHGVAGLITPWNFPAAIPLWKALPALTTGNAVVLKSSSEAIGVATLLEGLAREALPADLLQVIVGGRAVAETLIDEVDVISFTGSTPVGMSVVTRSAARGIPAQAEMGGHNPAVVLPDADPVAVSELLTAAATGYAGQKCTATRRIVVVGNPATLLKHLRDRFAALVPGDPATSGGGVGPLINSEAVAAFEQAVADARAAGADVVQSAADLPVEGWYVRPTLVSSLPSDHRLLRDETFGPIVAVQTADSIAEAIALANDVPYGLAASVHGRDLAAVIAVLGGLEAGMVKVNATTTGADFWMPFGGDKLSSAGPREQGKAALDFYTTSQTVTVVAG